MKKKKYAYLFALLSALLLCIACEETDTVDEYDNWEVRNEAFIDSIANVAKANSDGKWLVFPSYRLVDTVAWENNFYVYCHEIASGDGDAHPLFSDTIRTNYRGRLIPTTSYPDGYIFDQSYKGNLDVQTDVPSKLSLAGRVSGFVTAVQQMVIGDRWMVYIPADLGYGNSSTSYIPAYSALIFDINLVGIYPIGEPVPEWK